MAFDRSRSFLPRQRPRLLVGAQVPMLNHPLMQGISYLRRFDRRMLPDFIEKGYHDGYPMVLQNGGDYKGGIAGAGLSPHSVLATSNATYKLPTAGTLLSFVSAGFAPTDSVWHTICSFGNDATYAAGPAFDFQKYSSNSWIFGWFAGSDTRVSVAASGTFSQGEPFVAGGTWDSTATKLYVKGKLIGTNAVNSGAGDTSGYKICFGSGNQGGGPGIAPWSPNQHMTSVVHWIAVWSRLLSSAEIFEISFNPMVLWTYQTQTFVPSVGVVAAATGSKQAAVTVIS